jgi:hypothetical protein
MVWGDSDENRLIESDRRLAQCEANHSKRHEEKQYGTD